jgi:hypothetical protein
VTAFMNKNEGFNRHVELKKFIGACRDEADALGQATIAFRKDLPSYAIDAICAIDITDAAREIMATVDASQGASHDG